MPQVELYAHAFFPQTKVVRSCAKRGEGRSRPRLSSCPQPPHLPPHLPPHPLPHPPPHPIDSDCHIWTGAGCHIWTASRALAGLVGAAPFQSLRRVDSASGKVFACEISSSAWCVAAARSRPAPDAPAPRRRFRAPLSCSPTRARHPRSHPPSDSPPTLAFRLAYMRPPPDSPHRAQPLPASPHPIPSHPIQARSDEANPAARCVLPVGALYQPQLLWRGIS